jgi:hypothetical protein
VTAEHAEPGIAPVLLDEQVQAVHLSTEHSAKQFIERLGWAITDAESVEAAQRPVQRRGRAGGPPARARSRARRHPLHA